MLKMEPWRADTLILEAWRLRMEPLRVCRPVVADLNQFVEEEEEDLNPD
jgi:hypothetical protein